MEISEKRKQLETRLAKAEEQAKKGKEAIRDIKKKLKELNKPTYGLTRKQENTIKIWHGIACLAIIKEKPEFAQLVRDYLEKHVKSDAQRRLMHLSVAEPAPEKSKPKVIAVSAVFDRVGPILAKARVDLVVPYPTPDNEHEKAKAAGATWDPQKKVWFVPEGFDLTKVERWLPEGDWKHYGLV